jgi:hypothetical protein
MLASLPHVKIRNFALSANASQLENWNAMLLEGEQIAISVSDTGIGTPAGKQESIFRAFEQADGSTAREYGGTGLGLSVTRQLVELQGGAIYMESEVGKGSQFSFTIPRSTVSWTERPDLAGSRPDEQLLGVLDQGRKPFSKDELHSRIKTHLHLHRIHRAAGGLPGCA